MALGLLLTIPWSCASGKDAPRVDPGTLKSWLADPQVVILDVRAAEDWEKGDKKIKGAVRQDPKDVKTWAATLPKDKKIVLYCA
jgi:rhodanese-related sulfurtransferase